MRRCARALLLAALAAACARAPEPPAADPASLRHPPAGDVVGFVSPYGSAWRGIPYAAAPVGERRWQAPRPAAAWSGTRQATGPAPICPQLASRFGGDASAAVGSAVGGDIEATSAFAASRRSQQLGRGVAAPARGRRPRRVADETAAFLRSQSPAQLFSAYATEEDEGLIDVPQLFRDGAVLPREPIPARLASGDFHRVPVVLGTNRDENKLFLIFDRELATWWLGLLPRLHDEERYQAFAEHMSRWWKATAADGPASALVAASSPDVFVDRFDWDEEPNLFLLADLAKLVGAAHGFEIPFVFGHWDLGPLSRRLFTAGNAQGRERLSGQMMSYWAELAYAGAPGRGRRGDLPEWTPWTDAEGASRTMVFDTPADGGVRMRADSVTEAQVIAAIGADPRLASQRDRCAVYRRLARWGRDFDAERYARAGCASDPIAEYPWRDAHVAAGG